MTTLRINERPSVRHGFTVIEVLVALAIFAMGAITLAGAYIGIVNAYDIASRSNAFDADVAYARSLLTKEGDRTKVEQGADFDGTDRRRVHWSAEITSTSEADLFAVAFTCEISETGVTGGPKKITENFLLLRPTWSTDAAERTKLKEDAKTRILELQGKKQ